MITLKPVTIPEFGLPEARPRLSSVTYAERCDRAYGRAGTDWVVVYADREHLANIAHLTGFEPRFEEALLLLGPGNKRILVTGNESESYAPVSPLEGLEVVLAQSLSLMGQDRTRRPRLEEVLREAGLAEGRSVGVVGWKYYEAEEWTGQGPVFAVPHAFIAMLARIVGAEALSDATAVLMHPETGERATIDADGIAEFEWGSARASASVWRVLRAAKPGLTEYAIAAHLGYAGEPLTCHTMLTSASPPDPVIGLSSPSARVVREGDGITTAIGYWGGLSSRAGLLARDNEEFLTIAKGYFSGLLAWYEAADIGTSGGDLHAATLEALGKANLRSALNPGHLTSYDEWSHSPVFPGSRHAIRSGMPFQVDVIPTPVPSGWALNCEDGIVFADEALRASLKERHPAVAKRIEARRAFVSDQLGVALKPSILPLSNIPLCLPPFWLSPDRLLALG